MQTKLSVTEVVYGVGEKVLIVAHNECPQSYEFLSPSHFVEIEQHLFLRFQALFLAAIDRILLTFFGTRVVVVFAPPHGHGQIRLFDV